MFVSWEDPVELSLSDMSSSRRLEAGAMTGTWLNAFDANPDALLDELLQHVTTDMLIEIASADYGQDIDQHLAPLIQFREYRILPVLDWHPLEVLELIRWSEPEQPDWKPGATGARGHLLRAFACALLLRAHERQENSSRCESFNETAIQLVLSLRAIGGPILQPGVRFMAWCVTALAPLDHDGIEGPFLGLALLSLVASSDCYSDRDVVSLCQWIDERVSLLLENDQYRATGQWAWLLSANPQGQRNTRWVELGRCLYHYAEAQGPSDRATWVALVGRALAED